MKDRSLISHFAVLQLASLICMSVCFGGPAAPEGAQPRVQQKTPGMVNSFMQSAFRPRGTAVPVRPRLDLRIPDNTKPVEGYPTAPARAGVGTGAHEAAGLQLPFARPRSPAEEFVNRVHHEGLPLARLWENKSALVSLGLNQRGQAGLWLIQKIQ